MALGKANVGHLPSYLIPVSSILSGPSHPIRAYSQHLLLLLREKQKEGEKRESMKQRQEKKHNKKR